MNSDHDSLAPHEQLSLGTGQIGNWLFDPLVCLNSRLEIEPVLAESWEQISPTTMRFYLCKGVKFHSGNPMTADDVIFSYNRLLHSDEFKGLFSHYDNMKKVDDYAIDITNNKSYPLVVENLAHLFVLDKKFYTGKDGQGHDKSQVSKAVKTFASTHESGTGPFMLQRYTKGVQSVFVRNPSYWGKTGNVDKFTLNTISDDDKRVEALLSGKVDWIYPVPTQYLEKVKNTPSKKVYSIPSDRIILFQMNESVVPAFKDKRVREAVLNAIDTLSIVRQVMDGFATVAAQNSPVSYSGHNTDLKPRYDLEKAKALMKDAGYANGFTVSMIAPNNRYVNDEKIAQTVANMLSKINIKVNLTTLPEAQYWDEFDKCAHGLQMIGWDSDTGDSANYSEYLTMTCNDSKGTGRYNCNGFSDPKLDSLINHANSLPAGKQRNKLLRQTAQREYDDAIFIPLHWENQNWGYSNKMTNFPDIVNMKNFPLF